MTLEVVKDELTCTRLIKRHCVYFAAVRSQVFESDSTLRNDYLSHKVGVDNKCST